MYSNNVIGPFSQQDWLDMLDTKRSITFMIQTDPIFYREAIRKEKTLLKVDYFCRIAA